MTQKPSGYLQALPVLFLLAILITLAVSCGCTQQAAQPSAQYTVQPAVQDVFNEVTASQPDATHIVITYEGGPNMEKIIELETTITDSFGKSQTKSAGSRLATTPIPIKGTYTISGDFSGADHVVVVAHMSDGSRKTVVDTTI